MKTHVLGFRVGSVRAAALTQQIDRVLPFEPLMPAPGAPGYVIGLLKSAGRVLAVIDAGKRAFPHEKILEEPRFLLAGAFGGIPAVLAVPEVEGIFDVESFHEPVPDGLPEEMASILGGAVKAGGVDRVLLDVSRMLERDRTDIEVLASGE